MADLRRFAEDYESAADDVSNSDYNMFATNLDRWFEVIEDYPDINSICRRLEDGHDFEEMVERDAKNSGGMIGSEDLVLPKGKEQRLGMQISAMRSIRDRRVSISDIDSLYFGSSTKYQDMMDNIVRQIFAPLSRDLFRYISANLNVSPIYAPASDRFVPINHNSQEYQNVSSAVDGLLDEVRKSNSFSDPEEKDLRLAEIAASKTILSSIKVRVSVIYSLVLGTLTFLATIFAETAIGNMAQRAITDLGTLTGLW